MTAARWLEGSACRRPRLLGPTALAALAIAWMSIPGVARAGGVNDKFDILHIRPFVGYEISSVGALDFNIAGANSSYKADSFNVSGLAWGGYAGFRIGLISGDVLYQRTEFGHTNDGRTASMNKLYGDLGFNFGSGWLRGMIDLAFGYSWLELQGAPSRQGFGGRIGASLDFFLARWFSIGPTASLDLQGYSESANGGTSLVGAYGGTFTARIGLHL
jgi:hypothetical protein